MLVLLYSSGVCPSRLHLERGDFDSRAPNANTTIVLRNVTPLMNVLQCCSSTAGGLRGYHSGSSGIQQAMTARHTSRTK